MARILAEVGDIARFGTEDKFASYNGTVPIGVSPGAQVRHPLSRARNRSRDARQDGAQAHQKASAGPGRRADGDVRHGLETSAPASRFRWLP